MNIEEQFNLAAQAAIEGNKQKAKELIKPGVEARHSESLRLYAQLLVEEGRVDTAIDILLEALVVDPKNVWALVLMGNIYAKKKNDYATAKKYFDKVLEYHPDNSIAINNLGGLAIECGKYDEAISLFKSALNHDQTYPNSYYGLANAYVEKKEYLEAFYAAKTGCLISVNRPENKDIRMEIIRVMMYAAQKFVEDTNYMNVVLGIRDELQQETTNKIEFFKDDSLKVYAKLEYGPHHFTDKHIVRYNGELPNFEHVMIHELGHLRMQLAASKTGKGKAFSKTADNDNAFSRKYGKYLRKTLQNMDASKMAQIISQVQEGICLQLMNCPLDLFVERYIHDNYRVMGPIQFLVLFKQEQDNIKGVQSGKELSAFPRAIVEANKVMNICTSLNFKKMYGIDLINEFKPTKAEYEKALDLLDEFEAYWKDTSLKPGDEYELAEYFISSFDMEDIISIVPEEELYDAAKRKSESRPMSVDAGDYDMYTEEEKERQRRFEENSRKEDPARDMMMTMYILAALEEFAKMTKPQVRKIAMEIAMLGMNGIDPSKQSGYRIPSLDRDFGGYLLLAYYYTSWKLTIPEGAEQLGLPYLEQYRAAQQLYAKRNGGNELSF